MRSTEKKTNFIQIKFYICTEVELKKKRRDEKVYQFGNVLIYSKFKNLTFRVC
jgi:hypothetical protein